MNTADLMPVVCKQLTSQCFISKMIAVHYSEAYKSNDLCSWNGSGQLNPINEYKDMCTASLLTVLLEQNVPFAIFCIMSDLKYKNSIKT